MLDLDSGFLILLVLIAVHFDIVVSVRSLLLDISVSQHFIDLVSGSCIAYLMQEANGMTLIMPSVNMSKRLEVVNRQHT